MIESVPIERAVLCEACRQVAERQASARCPLCGSQALFSLAGLAFDLQPTPVEVRTAQLRYHCRRAIEGLRKKRRCRIVGWDAGYGAECSVQVEGYRDRAGVLHITGIQW